MGTHWELDGNIAIRQKKILPFGLWKVGRGGRYFKVFDFSETLSPDLKIFCFFFQGGFF
jgi:hypothetical protein